MESVQQNPKKLLFSALAADVCAAGTASLCVAPFITIIDRSIIRSANGSMALKEGVTSGLKQLFTRPLSFFAGRDFRIVWGLYGCTYIAANTASSMSEFQDVSDQLPKFICSSMVNIGLCIRKDAIFTKMFGLAAVAQSSVPMISLGMFTVRDCLTLAASFNAPEYMSAALSEKNAQAAWGLTSTQIANISQMVCPVAVQFFSTPLHLTALDLFNRPQATNGERAAFVKTKYPSMVLARCSRIIPAFGIGGIGNKKLKNFYRESFGVNELRGAGKEGHQSLTAAQAVIASSKQQV